MVKKCTQKTPNVSICLLPVTDVEKLDTSVQCAQRKTPFRIEPGVQYVQNQMSRNPGAQMSSMLHMSRWPDPDVQLQMSSMSSTSFTSSSCLHHLLDSQGGSVGVLNSATLNSSSNSSLPTFWITGSTTSPTLLCITLYFSIQVTFAYFVVFYDINFTQLINHFNLPTLVS